MTFSPFFWRANAIEWLRVYAEQFAIFRIEDVRVYAYSNGLQEPPDSSVWNTVSRFAARLGYIEKVGFARASHQTLKIVTVWGSLIAPPDAEHEIEEWAFNIDDAPSGTHTYDPPYHGWRGLALEAMRRYATSHVHFTVEELRDSAAVPIPVDQRAWGAVVTTARRLGWITANGVRITAGGKNNSTKWRSLIFVSPPARRRPR